jgi:hypothetical protein
VARGHLRGVGVKPLEATAHHTKTICWFIHSMVPLSVCSVGETHKPTI